jgi:HAD superfamily hydrolase (TIGR01549 family)
MRCILFDLDGTLIESTALYTECIQSAVTAELGSSPPYAEIVASMRPTSERAFLMGWLGDEVGARVHARVCDVYEARVGELLGGFYSGVAELLEGLRAAGLRMGLVSGKSRRAFAATCAAIQLREFFDAIVLEDDVLAPKPDPAGLLQALASLGISTHDALYVGDTRADLEAARRAGMVGACALWSRSDHERRRLADEVSSEVWLLHSPQDLAARLLR